MAENEKLLRSIARFIGRINRDHLPPLIIPLALISFAAIKPERYYYFIALHRVRRRAAPGEENRPGAVNIQGFTALSIRAKLDSSSKEPF